LDTSFRRTAQRTQGTARPAEAGSAGRSVTQLYTNAPLFPNPFFARAVLVTTRLGIATRFGSRRVVRTAACFGSAIAFAAALALPRFGFAAAVCIAPTNTRAVGIVATVTAQFADLFSQLEKSLAQLLAYSRSLFVV
jgi:hypothetical protein